MQKTKHKTDTPITIGLIPFIILWTITHAGGWFAVLLKIPVWMLTPLGIAGVLIIPAMLQVLLVERGLRRPMRGWLWATFAGMLVTQVTFVSMSPYGNGFFMEILPLLLPVALAQSVWLRQHVQSAWLWPLASVAGAGLFSLALVDMRGNDLLFVVGALVYGLVQGAIFHHLWQLPAREKAKTGAASEREDAGRAARLALETHQAVIAPWSVADAPQTQEGERGR